MTQLVLFNPYPHPPRTGRQLRDKGMTRALNHAEKVKAMWGRLALEFLHSYCETHLYFAAEDVRGVSMGIIPIPSSLRAWGNVMVAGAKRGWMVQDGTAPVRNPKAHAAYASVWKSLIYRG